VKGVATYIGDLFSTKVIESAIKDCDAVIHCASLINYTDWNLLKRTNVDGTKNLIEICKKYPIMRFVYISSTAVYGKKINFANEFTPPNPDNLYGKSKLEAERLVLENFSEVPSVILRPSIIYGPTYIEYYSKVIKLAIKAKLPIIGNGKNIIPFVHAKDVASAIIKSLQTDFSIGKIYIINENVSVDQEKMINYLYELVGKGKPMKIPVFLARIAAKVLNFDEEDINVLSSHRIFDCTLANKEIKWYPKIGILNGIREMFELFVSSSS
jgi:nucleoside-diphosphate-sugar epimerase